PGRHRRARRARSRTPTRYSRRYRQVTFVSWATTFEGASAVDENRTVNTLRDEVGLEIERVLAIDPAPDLQLRVLARIEHERTSHPWWAPWRPLRVGAIGM